MPGFNMPLVGDRFAPYNRPIIIFGADFTSASFRMQLRTKPDAPGSPLLDLENVTESGQDGIRILSSGWTSEESPRLFTLINVHITQASMSGLPSPPLLGDPAILYYDFQIAPSGADKRVLFGGEFQVKAGVTQ